MSKNVVQELPELLEAGVISQATAAKIKQYYAQQQEDAPNRILIIFGILGALLVGLGIILIIAHNWDNLSKNIKTTFAFIPLLIGQLACGYTLLKKRESRSWSEASGTFLTLAIGASISLVSQIYNIPGDINSFMFTWCLLALPLVYLLKSSMVSLLYIAGITFLGVEENYSYLNIESYRCWGLLLLIVPHYYQLIRSYPRNNFTLLHHLFFAGSVAIMLSSFADENGHVMLVTFMNLFGVYYLIGQLDYFKNQKLYLNFYQIIGSVGSLIMLFVLSFIDLWEDWSLNKDEYSQVLISSEFLAGLILLGVGLFLLLAKFKTHSFKELSPLNWAFILLFFLFFLGKGYPIFSTFITNILVFTIGMISIQKGIKTNHLGILNYGLLILTILIICRFLDLDLTFVTRGVLFILVGLGFFITNYRMLQKRKAQS